MGIVLDILMKMNGRISANAAGKWVPRKLPSEIETVGSRKRQKQPSQCSSISTKKN